jgi:hypothetical protein
LHARQEAHDIFLWVRKHHAAVSQFREKKDVREPTVVIGTASPRPDLTLVFSGERVTPMLR